MSSYEHRAKRAEAINDHGEALRLRCLAAGRKDLAQRVERINAEHERAGYLTHELGYQRDAVANALAAFLKTRSTP